jgi:hypothetical protein
VRVPAGWWTEAEDRRAAAELDAWVYGVADGLRAERIERLRARAHEIDMRGTGALSADRWERIQRRRTRHHGYQFESWGAA